MSCSTSSGSTRPATPTATRTSCQAGSGSGSAWAGAWPPAPPADGSPQELSGGQRRRGGVARARPAAPPVLLMDEPFGALDPITRLRLQDEFGRLQSELRKTVVFVTHDIEEAVRLGDRI